MAASHPDSTPTLEYIFWGIGAFNNGDNSAVFRYQEAPAMETTDKPRVLLVDDERLILRCLSRFLREVCEVFTANDYEEAEDLLLCQRVDAVVSDCRMPGRGGADVLSASLILQPAALRIMYSADAPHNIDALEKSGVIEHFFEKPGHRELKALLVTLSPRILDKAS